MQNMIGEYVRFLTIVIVTTASLHCMEKELYNGEFKDFLTHYKDNTLDKDVAIVWEAATRFRDIAYGAGWDAKIRVWRPNEKLSEIGIKIEHNFSLNLQSVLYLAYYNRLTQYLDLKVWPTEKTPEEKKAEQYYLLY